MSNKTPTAGNDKASPEDVGHQLAVPSPDLGDSAWVMHGINRLEEKTSRLEGKIDFGLLNIKSVNLLVG